MSTISHLRLQSVFLSHGREWTPAHHIWTCVIVRNGTAYALGHGQPRIVDQGDVVVMPRPCLAFRASQVGNVELQYFTLVPHLLEEIVTLADFLRIAAHTPSPDCECRFVAPTDSRSRDFSRICDEAPALNPTVLRCRLLTMAAELLVDRSDPDSEPASNGRGVRRIERLVRSISANELRIGTTSELASWCRCSTQRFRRLFESYFGCSLREKKQQLALEHANQLVRYTQVPLGEIARQCGFHRTHFFCDRFIQAFGIHPSKLRSGSEGEHG